MFFADVVGLVLSGGTREDVLSRMCDELVSRSVVDEFYFDAVTKREEIFPTGLPTTPVFVGIPHGGPEHVLRPGLAVAKLENPVAFGRMDAPKEEVPVTVVFLLAMPEGGGQVLLLKRIMELIENSSVLSAISDCQSSEEITLYLKPQFRFREE